MLRLYRLTLKRGICWLLHGIGNPVGPQRGIGIVLTSGGSEVPTIASEWTRWGQLVLGIICLVMIANLQYGWTLFIDPIDQKYHWGRAASQVAFTIYIVTETLAQDFESLANNTDGVDRQTSDVSPTKPVPRWSAAA